MTLTIERGVVQYLKGRPEINQLVGDRIYLIALPQKSALPAITYQRISTNRLMTHDQAHTGLSTIRVQFDIYADTYETAKDISTAMREVLLGYKGQFGQGASTVRVDAVLADLEADDYIPDIKLYTTTLDYMISHEE